MSYTPTNWASTDVVTASRMNALEQAVGDIDMSYTPNVWQDGDVLTASKMNALEQAVASGGGGGESDFTTATLKFMNSLGDGNRASYTASVICVLSDGIAIPDISVERNGEMNLTVPLYKGKISIPLPSVFVADTVDTTIMPQFSGNMEVSGMNLVITGDGTINAAGLQTAG